MVTLKFEQTDLVNLEYSLEREFLSTNRAGGYMNTTITCCNTRKYHGLFVAPVDMPSTDDGACNWENYVLLSSLDETIIQHGQSFNLAIHRFPNTYEPKGHKYITEFDYSPTPTIIYRVGGVELKKELLWRHSSSQLLIRYTCLNATSETTLRLRPMLAFRNVHSLSKCNMFANGHSYPIKGGVRNQLYTDLPSLYLQVDKPDTEFLPAPDWYFDFEYAKEAERGYDALEDLLTPGIFETKISKGESIIVSCSLFEENPSQLRSVFEETIAKRSDKRAFLPCLKHSARQFLIIHNGEHKLLSGYPWYSSVRGRDTFVSLPGITLPVGNIEECFAVLDDMVKNIKNGLFENYCGDYASADTSLWFFYTLQQIEEHTSAEIVWERYSGVMKQILSRYAAGIDEYGIYMHDNALIWAENDTRALTWMDAYANGVPVTKRGGYAVEVNALWYNAVCYTLQLAGRMGDGEVIAEWNGVPERIKDSFLNTFILNDKPYLADHVNQWHKNMQIRPNQLVACALKYKMISDEQIKGIVDTTKKHLLTTKGLRALSPIDADYQGVCTGDDTARATAAHQGSVWPWLLPIYLRANLNIHGKSFILEAEEIIGAFKDNFRDYGVGTVAELCDGNPPHTSRGAISYAMSVAAVMRMIEMVEQTKSEKE